jgi:prepilin-type processing-associated H-X9-DG protein
MTALRNIGCRCLVSVAVLVGLVSIAAGTPAEELAKRMPDGTVAFAATSGGDALKGDFQKSILGRLWNDPNARGFVKPLWEQLRTFITKEADDPNAVKFLDMGLDYASLVGSRPILVGVAKAEVKQGPPICGFAIVDAGERKAAMVEALAQAEAQAPKGDIIEIERASLKLHSFKDANDVPIYWGWVGNYFVVGVNDNQDAVLKSVGKPRAASPAGFKEVSGTDDAMVFHFDCQGIGGLVGAIAAHEGEEADVNDIKKALTQLGLAKIGTITGRAGFAGPDVVSDEFLEAPEPRTGLLASFKPVDPALMELVDPNAVQASAFNVDFAGIYDTVFDTIKSVAPKDAREDIEKGLIAVESELHVNIRKDLLGAMAGPVVSYSLPSGKMLEAPMGGSIAVVKLKDPALFEKTMVLLGAYIAGESEGALQVRDQNDNGRTIHTWAIPTLALMQVMPTWSVVGDNLVIGSNSALHEMECKYVQSGGKRPASLAENANFKKTTAGVPKNVVALTYVDSQVQFTQIMTSLQQVWPLATMAVAQRGVSLPVLLPNLGAVIRQMQPGCQYAYFDAEGLHSHYQGTGIETGLQSVAVGALGAGIALPALARTRQQAMRMATMSSLKSVGMACFIYANDHNDKLPPDLETLVKGGQLTAKTLESRNKPKDFEGPSFIYIAGQTPASSPANIVAYENPEFSSEGVAVLYLDGHVAFVKPEEFRKDLAETYKRLGREAPAIRFKDEPKPRPSSASARESLSPAPAGVNG